MKWQRELPDSEGDWMWVWMWSCGCCVQRHGLVWVDQHYFSEEEAKKHYRTINGKFAIHYGSDAPEFGEITAWAKIELPPEDWDFDERVIVPIKPEEVKKVEKPEPKPDSFMEYWLNEKHKTEELETVMGLIYQQLRPHERETFTNWAICNKIRGTLTDKQIKELECEK